MIYFTELIVFIFFHSPFLVSLNLPLLSDEIPSHCKHLEQGGDEVRSGENLDCQVGSLLYI